MEGERREREKERTNTEMIIGTIEIKIFFLGFPLFRNIYFRNGLKKSRIIKILFFILYL